MGLSMRLGVERSKTNVEPETPPTAAFDVREAAVVGVGR